MEWEIYKSLGKEKEKDNVMRMTNLWGQNLSETICKIWLSIQNVACKVSLIPTDSNEVYLKGRKNKYNTYIILKLQVENTKTNTWSQ